MRFHDRVEGGKALAAKLLRYAHRPDVIVLGLPRGGMPVALEVARALEAPLDVLIVRKLGVPGEEELALGAIATGGGRVINQSVVQSLGISRRVIDAVTQREQEELKRREHAYRDARPLPTLRDRVVILVDDGIATGATMRAAVSSVRQQQPSRIVVAVPVAAPESVQELRDLADEVICVLEPEAFWGVGLWYEQFPQLTDDDVVTLLNAAWHEHATSERYT